METHMEQSPANWLRELVEQSISNSSPIAATENVLEFQPPSHSTKNQGAAALALVYRAADLIGDIDHRATERHACAEALADQAIEKLKNAEVRIRSAESERYAAEAELNEYKGRVEELTTKLEEIEKAADCRIRSAELAREAAVAELNEYRDSLERLAASVREMEKAIKEAASSSAVTQAELAASEQRAISAEMRASETETALKHIEAALRTQILEKTFGDSGKNAVRAA